MKPLRDDELLSRAGKRIGESVPRDTSADLEAGRRRFVDTISAPPRVGLRRAHVLVVGLTAVVTVLAALVVWPSFRERPIGYVVVGAQVSPGGFVQAPPGEEASLRLDDGSQLTLAPGARGRLTEVRARGVRFSIETGSVGVEVAKREGGADYVLDAGPYAVRVTGTRFVMSWEPAHERMRLDLTEGSVVITGPQAEAGLTLRAGQNVTLEPDGIRVADASSRSVPSLDPPSPSSTTLPPPSESALPAPSASTSAKAERGPSWAERVAAGDFEGVLADAEARGIDATLNGAGAGELMTLADAARYGGKSQLAGDALRAVRKRFPGTKAASTAAFLLGRMAEDGGRSEQAINLYDTTLAEGGTFAAEALGRKMLLIQRRSGNAGARATAEQYLKSYPRGAYATAARTILGQ